MSDPIQIVKAWHETVNSGDIGRLAGLVSEDVEIGGPRGTDRGPEVLVEWVERTGIRLEPTVWYQRGETVVVCQLATWPGESGTPGDPQPAASAFVVRDDRIMSIVRYADQIAAFGATGLAATDRVQD
ncbi:MAG TPA: nuclear transport factor 2 family protein [Thermomicrobiales bacterium]|nr:nuclear transport factor 2 family protein [Thermomicrobiales bacterium]